MSSLKAAYLNELYKISKKKKIIVAGTLTLIAVIVAIIIVTSMQNFMGINVTGSSEFAIMVLQVISNTLIPLFTIFICIEMFSGEFSHSTIKTTLTVPASRLKVFSAKILALGTFIMANLLFVMVISTIASLFLSGTTMSVFHIIMSYLVTFLPLFVFALMVVLISNLTKGSGSAFMLSILAFLIFKVLEFLLPNFSSFFYTSTFDFYILFTGISFNINKILRTLLILAGYILMFFSMGYTLFEKREI